MRVYSGHGKGCGLQWRGLGRGRSGGLGRLNGFTCGVDNKRGERLRRLNTALLLGGNFTVLRFVLFPVYPGREQHSVCCLWLGELEKRIQRGKS